MFSMYGCLLLLALAISPSAPQQETITAEQSIVALAELLGEWKTQTTVTNNLFATGLDDIEDEAARVKALNEQFLVDFADLVKTVQETQNVTSQLLVDLQVLKGRQAVAGAIQGAQVFMFLAYLSTIFVIYLVKHCKKHHEKAATTRREEFEQLYQASRANGGRLRPEQPNSPPSRSNQRTKHVRI